MRALLALVLTVALVAPVLAASPFSDVPKTHWAYDAIQKAVDAGILQGYNGKFEGQRLLNRYQMAVVVAKLIDAVKTPGGATLAGAGNLKNIEALTTEFADELALLNTKVTTLEGTTQELQKDIEALKGGTGGATGNGLGFTAFASFGLVSTDKGDTGVGNFQAGPSNWYTLTSPDETFFTLPQASIGVDKEVNEGVYFHAQFDYQSDVNGAAGTVLINECYFMVDEIFGDIGAKVGAFALPYSMEHNGPFRTCNYTISPSYVNSINEAWRGYGLEFQPVADVEEGDILWKLGIVSGTDGFLQQAAANGSPFYNWDHQTAINQLEQDDSFGYYLYVGSKADGDGFGWQLGYFDNNGDSAAAAPSIASPEVSFWQVGFEWWNDKLGVMGQYLDGSFQPIGATESMDVTAWYLMLNFKIDDKNNVSLRYDDGTWDDWNGATFDGDMTGYCFAFNHKVTENSLFQFEWLTADTEISNDPTATDPEDDLIQLRYKVHF